MSVPATRIRALNDRALRSEGEWVLYWMSGARRRHHNFALQRAVELARDLRRPLVIASDLRRDMPWASVRLHRFLLQGMLSAVLTRRPGGVRFLPLIERKAGAATRAIKALAGRAAAVVVDDQPWADTATLQRTLADACPVACEAVDAWGLLPLSVPPLVYPTAFSFRCHLQKVLAAHLSRVPEPDPLAGLRLPRVPALPEFPGLARADAEALVPLIADPSALGVDASVGAGIVDGGSRAALAAWRRFRDDNLGRYGQERNHPDEDVSSGLSPYLHHGQVAVHAIWADLVRRYDWSPDRIGKKIGGKKEGWWGLPPAVEAFLDELITWRELGANFCARRDDFASYESLPAWARLTLEKHERDPRPHLYTRDQLEGARTHDAVWNAAQRQLVAEGRLHNYLRMLWGKKILEWSPSPRDAAETMIALNNRYALDGQDPNSYSGIFWVLGRYDRPWAPERPIYGSIRYMSSENTIRKLRMKQYLERYAGG